jgi:hypothetical protein
MLSSAAGDHYASWVQERDTMGDVSRRAVLGAGAGIAGLVTLGFGASDADAAVVSSTIPLRSHYKRSLGRVFTAKHGGHTYHLRLTHIHNLPDTTAKLHPHCFTLVFAPVGKAHLHDAIYTVRSHAVGSHHLFLSSIGSDRGMQAVVNRKG